MGSISMPPRTPPPHVAVEQACHEQVQHAPTPRPAAQPPALPQVPATPVLPQQPQSAKKASVGSGLADMSEVIEGLKALMKSGGADGIEALQHALGTSKDKAPANAPLRHMKDAKLENFDQAVQNFEAVVAKQQAKVDRVLVDASKVEVEDKNAEKDACVAVLTATATEAVLPPVPPSLPPGLGLGDSSKPARFASAAVSASATSATDEWWNYHSESFQVVEPDTAGVQIALGLGSARGEVASEKSSQLGGNDLFEGVKPSSAKSNKSKDAASTHVPEIGEARSMGSPSDSVDDDGSVVDSDGGTHTDTAGSTPQESAEEHVHADGALLYYNEPVRQLEHERALRTVEVLQRTGSPAASASKKDIIAKVRSQQQKQQVPAQGAPAMAPPVNSYRTPSQMEAQLSSIMRKALEEYTGGKAADSAGGHSHFVGAGKHNAGNQNHGKDAEYARNLDFLHRAEAIAREASEAQHRLANQNQNEIPPQHAAEEAHMQELAKFNFNGSGRHRAIRDAKIAKAQMLAQAEANMRAQAREHPLAPLHSPTNGDNSKRNALNVSLEAALTPHGVDARTDAAHARLQQAQSAAQQYRENYGNAVKSFTKWFTYYDARDRKEKELYATYGRGMNKIPY